MIHKEQVEVIINLLNLYGENENSHHSLLNECGYDGGGYGVKPLFFIKKIPVLVKLHVFRLT